MVAGGGLSEWVCPTRVIMRVSCQSPRYVTRRMHSGMNVRLGFLNIARPTGWGRGRGFVIGL